MKTNNEKKQYSTPEIKDWGNITTLTQGGGSGIDDLPLPGGSGPAFVPPGAPKTS